MGAWGDSPFANDNFLDLVSFLEADLVKRLLESDTDRLLSRPLDAWAYIGAVIWAREAGLLSIDSAAGGKAIVHAIELVDGLSRAYKNDYGFHTQRRAVRDYLRAVQTERAPSPVLSVRKLEEVLGAESD